MSDNVKFFKAIEHIDKQEFAKAVKLLSNLINNDSEKPAYYSERGTAYFHLNKKQKAFDDMDKALQLDSGNPYRYACRAFIFDAMGKTQKAVEDYEIAVKLDPEDAIAWNNLGLLQEKLGRKMQSHNSYKKSDSILGIDKNREERFKNEVERLNKEEQEKVVEPNHGEPIQPRNIQKELDQEQKELLEKGKAGIIKDVFTNKSTFKEFINFIKNGFKIK